MDAKASASNAHKLWCFWGKPKNGYICQLMQRTRAQCKYAIRHCRKHEARIQADSLANCLASKNYGSFWQKISRTVAPDSTYSSKVGSAIGPKDICDLWFNHYQTLFNGVSYNEDLMQNIITSVSPDRDDIKNVTCMH